MPDTKGIRAGRAYVELLADNSKLIAGLRRAAARLKAFGATVRAAGLKLMGLGALVAAPLAGAAKAFASMGDTVAKMAKRTGVSTETLSELRYVASQTGTEFGALEMSFRRMQRSIYDAGRGLSTAKDSLADLGITFEDLDGLSPEQQFKVLAEQLSKVADPTKKAAIAMTLFGRTGTNLLPMFAQGAAGIEALQQQARKLGLTIGSEDARAAEDLTDAFDRLWKVVKMGVFHIGAALAPALQRVSEWITTVMVQVRHWIEANRQVVVTVAAVVGGVLAAGAALTVLGAAISGLGTALSVLAGTWRMVLVGGKLFLAVLSAMLSPIGLVIAAVAALGAYVAHATGAAGKALQWLKDRFSELAEDARKAWGAIGNAMAAGDISLAAKVLWLTVKLEFLRGTGAIREKLEEWRFGLVALWENLVAGLTKIWLKLFYAMRSGWTEFASWHQGQVETWGNWMAKRWLEVQGLFDEGLDVDFAKRHVDQQSAARRAAIEQERKQKLGRIDQERDFALKAANQQHQDNLVKIGREHEARVGAMQSAVDNARVEWKAALAEANKAGAAAGKTPAAPGGPGKPDLDDILSGLGDRLGRSMERISVRGTFQTAALAGFGASGAVDRTADASEQTARNTKRLLQEIQRGAATFT